MALCSRPAERGYHALRSRVRGTPGSQRPLTPTFSIENASQSTQLGSDDLVEIEGPGEEG